MKISDRKEYNAILGTIFLGLGGLIVFDFTIELINYFRTGSAHYYFDKWHIDLYGFEAASCYAAMLFAGLLFMYLGSLKLSRLFLERKP